MYGRVSSSCRWECWGGVITPLSPAFLPTQRIRTGVRYWCMCHRAEWAQVWVSRGGCQLDGGIIYWTVWPEYSTGIDECKVES